ncbi:TPA: hypothetical protein ACYLN4_001152 [Burkholderia lata]
MGNFTKSSTLERAERVLELAQELVGSSDQEDLLVGTFRAGKVHGLQFTSDDSTRKANVCGNSSSDGYIVTVGLRTDYDFNSGASLDGVKRYDFDHDEAELAAQCLVGWVLHGVLPADREPTPC